MLRITFFMLIYPQLNMIRSSNTLMIQPETVCERIRVESNRLSLDPTPSRVWLDVDMR